MMTAKARITYINCPFCEGLWTEAGLMHGHKPDDICSDEREPGECWCGAIYYAGLDDDKSA